MKFPKQYPNITSNLQKICSVEAIGNSYVLRMINKDNRMNTRYVEAVAEALEDIETSYKLERKTEKISRALITVGQEHIYSNGLDIQGELDSEKKIYEFLKELNYILAKLMKFPMPTVAALNGHAFAGGAVSFFYTYFKI
jgi:enoyl-CoA hydratase/carnithine racemase